MVKRKSKKVKTPFVGLSFLPNRIEKWPVFIVYKKIYLLSISEKVFFLIFHKKWISLIIQTKVPNRLYILPRPSLYGHNGNNWRFFFFDVIFIVGAIKRKNIPLCTERFSMLCLDLFFFLIFLWTRVAMVIISWLWWWWWWWWWRADLIGCRTACTLWWSMSMEATSCTRLVRTNWIS